MDYHEAKDRTLWKLAATANIPHKVTPLIDVRATYWYSVDCYFCDTDAFCPICPVADLCTEWGAIGNDRRFTDEGLRYFFDKLLAISMPEII